MKRILLIARREYGAYAKTVGFWLSLLAFPLFAVLGGVLPRVLLSLREVLLHDVGARTLAFRLRQGVVAVEGEDAGGAGRPAPCGAHGRRHGVRRLLRRRT